MEVAPIVKERICAKCGHVATYKGHYWTCAEVTCNCFRTSICKPLGENL